MPKAELRKVDSKDNRVLTRLVCSQIYQQLGFNLRERLDIKNLSRLVCNHIYQQVDFDLSDIIPAKGTTTGIAKNIRVLSHKVCSQVYQRLGITLGDRKLDICIHEKVQLCCNDEGAMLQHAVVNYEERLRCCLHASEVSPDAADSHRLECISSYISRLATLLEAQNRLHEALPFALRDAEVLEQMMGPLHRDTLVAVSNLAQLCWRQEQFDKAEPLFRRVMAGR